MGVRRVPRTPQEIDATWLGEAVGVPFDAVDVEPLDAGVYGATARVRARRAGGAGVQSFVAKLASTSPDTKQAIGQAGFYRNEFLFYTQLAAASPVRVPTCHFAHYDPDTFDTLLLLEDLPGVFGDDVLGLTRAQALTALGAVSRMHRYWGDPARRAAYAWVPTFPASAFYRALGAIDAAYAARALEILGALAPVWLREHAPRTAEIMRAHLDALSLLEPTLLHSDLRGANLCFGPSDAEVALIDWQTPFRGPGIWDAANLMAYALRTEDRRAWQEDLWRAYFDGAPALEYARAATQHAFLVLAFNVVRNAPLFDLEKPSARALMEALAQRACAAAEDSGALALLR